MLIYHGPRSAELIDETGLEMIEAARRLGARIVVAATTDGQRELLQSLGLEDAIEGVVSLEGIARREGANFLWPETMPRLPDATRDIEAFKAAVRDYQERVMKPFGSAVGRILRPPTTRAARPTSSSSAAARTRSGSRPRWSNPSPAAWCSPRT